MRRPARSERGLSASIEMAVLVPALVLIIAVIIGAGRLALARLTVQQWADSAARTATLARDASTATARARAVVASDAAGSATRCREGWQLSVDAAAFALPVGQPGTVGVTVRCEVPLADLLLPGVPGTITVEGLASSTLDRYRGRS